MLIAALGILGTLGGTVVAQVGEAKRAKRAAQAEVVRRSQDRQDALDREVREAMRSDYREILRFVTRTRLFVMALRDRLAEFEAWSASASDDSREVEDLEARSEMLRVQLLEGLPDVHSLVGVWAPGSLLEIFDQIYNSGPNIKARVTIALHFNVAGERSAEGISEALEAVEHLIGLLNEARRALLAAHLPATAE